MMVRMGDSGTRTSCGPTVGRMTGNPGAGAAPWAAAVPAARTSARIMRPPGPVPVRLARLTPRSVATLRASGEALMRPPRERAPPPANAGAVERDGLGLGAAATGAPAAAATGAAAVVGAASSLGADSPSSSSMAMAAPMGTLSPSLTYNLWTIPEAKTFCSMVALSVWISATT